jgi:hypothetical protein
MSITTDAPGQAQPEPAAIAGIKLLVDQTGGALADATVPVRWCVTPALAERLADQLIVNPFVLISIRPYRVRREVVRQAIPATKGRAAQPEKTKEVRVYSRETSRYLVPLAAEMAYISFSTHGSNSVTACIVKGEEGMSNHDLKRLFLAQEPNGDFSKKIFGWENSELATGHHERKTRLFKYEAWILQDVVDDLTLEVPAQMFAKERAQWIQDYTSKFYSHDPFNQCKMRWRVGWGMVYLVPYLLIAFFARVIELVVAGYLGLRGIQLKGFWHPFKYRIIDVVSGCERSIWTHDKEGDIRPLWRLPLNPVTPVILALVIFGLGSIKTPHENAPDARWLGWGWQKALAVSVGVHVAISAVVLLAMLITVIALAVVSFTTGNKVTNNVGSTVKRFWTSTNATRKHNRDVRTERQRKADAAALKQALLDMTCTNEAAKVSIDALPEGKRTVRLWAQNNKRKVCKPYART